MQTVLLAVSYVGINIKEKLGCFFMLKNGWSLFDFVFGFCVTGVSWCFVY